MRGGVTGRSFDKLRTRFPRIDAGFSGKGEVECALTRAGHVFNKGAPECSFAWGRGMETGEEKGARPEV